MSFDVEYIDVDAIPVSHPVQQFHQFWQQLPKDQGIATWNDKLISVVPEIVPWMSMLVAAKAGRYLIRFCGASFEQMIGRNHQGLHLDEALPEAVMPDRLKELANIAAGNGPLFSKTMLPFKNKETIGVYRGVFGFSTTSDEIDRFALVIAPKT
ncbi:MAG: hypothetical protein AB3N28_15650 [Kordiimonas sp.]